MGGRKKSRANEFWEKKMDAFRRYGGAETRPQESFRKYLLAKRRLNFGLDIRQQNNLNAIDRFMMTPAGLPRTPSTFGTPTAYNSQCYKWIDNDDDFAIMMKDIVRCTEITLDLEGNQEHSYYGMTCLIQIGTYSNIYLIDPFPMFENICTRLDPVLSCTRCIKIMHGFANDIIALNRDFGINLAGAIDAQFLQQRLYAVLHDLIVDGREDRIQEYDIDGILLRHITNSEGKTLPASVIIKSSTELIGLNNLARLHFPKLSEPPKATMADWRIRPLPDEMTQYAVYDVKVLLHIWTNFKQLILKQSAGNWILDSAIADSKVFLRRYFIAPNRKDYTNAMRTAHISVNDRVRIELVYKWRNNHAKIIDESEDELLTPCEIHELVRVKPSTIEGVISIVGRQRRFPCESVSAWAHNVRDLVEKGQVLWNHWTAVKCHVCRGRNGYPHLAWGCVEPYSQRAVKAYMSEPANEAFSQKEEERRKVNRFRKWGSMRDYPRDPRY